MVHSATTRKWFGEAKTDPTWDALFDDLEQRREARRGGV